MPFFKRWKGLKMKEEDIRGLLPKVIEKLNEYNRFDKGKRELAEEISRNLLAEEKFRLNTDEINFYFACGMALHQEIEEVIYPKEDGKRKK